MRVELLSITENAEALIERGARICYDSKENAETRKPFIQNLIKRGHEGVLEHSVATFKISEVSRALTHQLVRHRLASYNQRSQRYVKEDGFDYVAPQSIINDKKAYSLYINLIEEINESYKKLLELGVPPEDARYILPNACHTEIIITMNFRELRHFLKLRLDSHAQWEIREMANRMLGLLIEHAPIVFEDIDLARLA